VFQRILSSKHYINDVFELLDFLDLVIFSKSIFDIFARCLVGHSKLTRMFCLNQISCIGGVYVSIVAWVS